MLIKKNSTPKNLPAHLGTHRWKPSTAKTSKARSLLLCGWLVIRNNYISGD